jgi:hypothetical protein
VSLELEVDRQLEDGVATVGNMNFASPDNGLVFLCHTLEPGNIGDHPKIPCGRYKMELVKSERFGMIVPRLIGVPGREYIEIHPGNKPGDTEGCTLVGLTEDPHWVGSSRVAFLGLMEFIRESGETEYYVTYKEPN